MASLTIGGEVHKITISSLFTRPSLISLFSASSLVEHPTSTLPDFTLKIDAAWLPANIVSLKALSGLRSIEFKYALGIRCPEVEAGSAKQSVKLLARALTSAMVLRP